MERPPVLHGLYRDLDLNTKFHTDINYWISHFKLPASYNNDKLDPAQRLIFDGTNGGKGFLAYKYRFQQYPDSYNVLWDFAALKREYLGGAKDPADHPHALKFGDMTTEGDSAETVYVFFNTGAVYGTNASSEGTTYINSFYSWDEEEGQYYRYMVTDLANPESNRSPSPNSGFMNAAVGSPWPRAPATRAGLALKGEPVVTDEETGAITFSNVIVQHIGMRWIGSDVAPLSGPHRQRQRRLLSHPKESPQYRHTECHCHPATASHSPSPQRFS